MAVANSQFDVVREMLRDLTDAPERSLSLPPACYFEPRFLEIERDETFFKSWQLLCHAEELRERGSIVSAARAETDRVLFRPVRTNAAA
jgi:phenylpropionate dioxygenase-like ring-hydroxylating dioxygenase large terminal subunit